MPAEGPQRHHAFGAGEPLSIPVLRDSTNRISNNGARSSKLNTAKQTIGMLGFPAQPNTDDFAESRTLRSLKR